MGQHEQLFCSLDTDGGPGMGGTGPHGIQLPAGPARRRSRQQPPVPGPDGRTHFNLLGWDGQGSAPGLFPEQGPASGRGRPVTAAVRGSAALSSPCKLGVGAAAIPDGALVDGIGRAGESAARTSPGIQGSARPVPALARRDAADRGRAALRGDVRPAPPVRAVPDLLPVRRHPQARDGHADLQVRLPGRRAPPARGRAARLPADGAGLRLPVPARRWRLLHAHRGDLELLRRALDKAGTPYADVVAAVCAHLPGLGRRELDLVRRAWEAGPPAEEVGLEPFAPPEYLAGYPVTEGTAGYRAPDDPAPTPRERPGGRRGRERHPDHLVGRAALPGAGHLRRRAHLALAL